MHTEGGSRVYIESLRQFCIGRDSVKPQARRGQPAEKLRENDASSGLASS